MSIFLGVLGIVCCWGAWSLFTRLWHRKVVLNPETIGEGVRYTAGTGCLVMLGIIASFAGIILLGFALFR